ncbi:putative DNA-binding domain-containing protein [Dyella sp. C11]|uniref:HvfC/BufC family peptide modification chaperone n=1 Tax=Dyella sp. C11 TaxID=2126991 RepID=UPI000D6461B4|nr:putative DNA-binding domain-containing protein [Dyella sp. C11]
MNLARWQQDFRDWLTVASNDASHRLVHGSTTGLDIYQNNYRAQLMSVLEASYPQVLARLGAVLFRDAAINHIDRHPPHAWTLDVYGENFEDTLRSLLPHNPDVHELAWVEWSLAQSFVAADADDVSNDDLASVDWETAELQLAPSLHLRRVTTNVEAIWSALYDDTEVPESEMLDASGGLITWRQGTSCRLRQTDATEYAALQSLHEDAHFASLCDVLVEHLGEDAGIARAGELLANWISAGIVIGIESHH